MTYFLTFTVVTISVVAFLTVFLFLMLYHPIVLVILFGLSCLGLVSYLITDEVLGVPHA